MKKDPYQIIKLRYVTEKTRVLESLKDLDSNRSLARCEAPKYVFIVDKRSNKLEIAAAIEEIYSEKNVKVKAVNTITGKPKPKGRLKGRPGKTASYKKAIVTLEKGDSLDEV